MTGKEERAQDQSATEPGWRIPGGPQLIQKVAYGLGAAVLAGAAVVAVPPGVMGGASRDGYVVTSVTLASPLNVPNLTTCCPCGYVSGC